MNNNNALQLKEISQKRTKLKSRPTIYNIELTGRCNYKPACVFCIGKNEQGYFDRGNIDLMQLERLWPYLEKSTRVNDCSYGEPLAYAALTSFIERLVAADKIFGFSTNGLLLDGKISEFLVRHARNVDILISINASTAGTYFKLHGQNFDKVVENIKRFANRYDSEYGDRSLPIYLSYIVMNANKHEVTDFLHLAKSLGISRVMLRPLFDFGGTSYVTDKFGYRFDYRKEVLSLAQYRAFEYQIKSNSEFSDLRISYQWNPNESFISEQSEEGIDTPCLFPWKFLCIRFLYDIYCPCVFMKKGIAAPSTTSIDDVWNSNTLIEMRRSLASGRIPTLCLQDGNVCPLVQEYQSRSGGKRVFNWMERKVAVQP